MKSKDAQLLFMAPLLAPAIAALGCCIFTVFAFSISDPPYPSDADMVTKYNTHKNKFNELADWVFKQDQKYFYDQANGCLRDSPKIENSSDAGCAMKSLGIQGVSAMPKDRTLGLTVASSGLGISGSTKKYSYSEKEPYNLLAPGQEILDFSEADRDKRYRNGYCRKIEENWYICISW